MTTVVRWTGTEIRALRQARRMTVRAFAEHVGVSARMVSKWEAAGESVEPRTDLQAALEMSLAAADAGVRARFGRLTTAAVPVPALTLGPGVRVAVRHPIDDKVMALVEAGPYQPAQGPAQWLPGFFIDVHTTTCANYDSFVLATGHPRPSPWPGGDTPVRVPWPDALAYCAWAGKSLPSPAQIRRAATGDEGVVVCDEVPEWSVDQYRTIRRVGPATPAPLCFRTVMPVPEMLALLAI